MRSRTIDLTAPSTHVQYDELDDKFPSVVEASKTIGLKYIVCPWIPEELRKSPDIWKQAADKFNHCGEQTKAAGIQFAYHNHWFEFLPVDGKLPYDELLTLCDANLVKMEMDLCWITAAGCRSREVLQCLSWTIPAGSRERPQDHAQNHRRRSAELR